MINEERIGCNVKGKSRGLIRGTFVTVTVTDCENHE